MAPGCQAKVIFFRPPVIIFLSELTPKKIERQVLEKEKNWAEVGIEPKTY